MRKRIFYISHITWNWIKQRPQFIAEELTHTYELTYFQPQVHRNRGLKVNEINNLAIEELRRFPTFGDRLHCVMAINDHIARSIISKRLRQDDADVVWIASPVAYNWLPAHYAGKLIYDCMDDHGAFLSGTERQKMNALEQRLVERADLVLASSSRLVDKMRGFDSTHEKKVLLVRNGFDGKVLDLGAGGGAVSNCHVGFKACYFGTIGPWFDFDVIQKSLDEMPDLSYRIIGPIDDEVEPLQDSRIEYTGPVAHDALARYVTDCDCFIMPFRINDVVLSVDPVKMYEYINFGKDIVCVRYPEVERFDGYAELYEGAVGYCESLRCIMERRSRKYTNEERLRILAESSWSSRMKPVFKALGDL